jgi:hypothetical protein
MDETFRIACAATDGPYLAAESLLCRPDPAALETLRRHRETAADPVARSLAALLAGWAESGEAVYLRALAYLDAAEERYRDTPLGAPRQDICAADLTAYFGDRLALFLAVRLLKQPAWPAWKVMTALTYLYDHRKPESLPPLIRYAAEAPVAASRAAGLTTLAVFDPAVLARHMLDEILYWRSAAPPSGQPAR